MQAPVSANYFGNRYNVYYLVFMMVLIHNAFFRNIFSEPVIGKKMPLVVFACFCFSISVNFVA